MKIAAIIAIISALLWSTISVIEIWTDIVSTDFYIKMTVSLTIISLASLFVGVAHREFLNKRNLKDEGYID